MSSLEQRLKKMEERAGITKREYPFDCIIEYDEAMTQEEIEKIMEERFQRSNTPFFLLLPKKKSNRTP